MLATHSEARHRPVILVVEDLEPLRVTMQQTLEEADFLVLSAANANQAWELAQSCELPIQLLITSLHPGGMLGTDLALRLRQRSPEMSVLYSSASPLAALEIPDPVEVVSSMLPRPFSKTTLLRRINTLLASHA